MFYYKTLSISFFSLFFIATSYAAKHEPLGSYFSFPEKMGVVIHETASGLNVKVTTPMFYKCTDKDLQVTQVDDEFSLPNYNFKQPGDRSFYFTVPEKLRFFSSGKPFLPIRQEIIQSLDSEIKKIPSTPSSAQHQENVFTEMPGMVEQSILSPVPPLRAAQYITLPSSAHDRPSRRRLNCCFN